MTTAKQLQATDGDFYDRRRLARHYVAAAKQIWSWTMLDPRHSLGRQCGISATVQHPSSYGMT